MEKIKEGISYKEYRGVLVDDDLNFYNKRTGMKITPFIANDGYAALSFKKEPGKKNFRIRVHTVVANCFIPNPKGYKYINHINGNKADYSINNLEWCTNSYNVIDGLQRDGYTYLPQKGKLIKATHKVTKEVQYFSTLKEAGSKLHVSTHTLSRVLKGLNKNNYDYDFELIY